VRNKSGRERACGLTRTVVEDVDFDEDAQAMVVAMRPVAMARSCRGMCGRRSPGYDLGLGRMAGVGSRHHTRHDTTTFGVKHHEQSVRALRAASAMARANTTIDGRK
jgi:hypothetical protein